MRHPIKIIIKRPKQTRGDWAFYREIDRILIEPSSVIKTEAQFCYYIYKRFGPGRYQCMAWQKGYEGFWLFWLGNLYENGFMRDLGKNKEIDKLKKEWNKAKTYEEKQNIEEDMEFEKKVTKESRRNLRRGPIGILKSRPGMIHQYQRW